MIPLNDRWRVAADPIQWILQRRRKNGGAGANSPKRQEREGVAYHRRRTALLASISTHCGAVPDDAMDAVRALPETHEAETVMEMIG